MISDDMYSRLLRYSRKVCSDLGIAEYYVDLTHDIICEGGITEQNFTEKFLEKKKELLSDSRQKPISIEHIPTHVIMSHYKYCPHCDDVLPETEFYLTGAKSASKFCKRYVSENNSGRKREQKVRRDRTEYVKLNQKKERLLVKDSYIKDILKKNGFAKEDITEAMIAEKRNSIIKKRSKIS